MDDIYEQYESSELDYEQDNEVNGDNNNEEDPWNSKNTIQLNLKQVVDMWATNGHQDHYIFEVKSIL